MANQNRKRAKNSTAPEVTTKYYLSNSKLLPEVIKSKAQGRVTTELAQMLMMLTRKYAQRPCFANYSYKEDMVSEAIANLCQNALKFKTEVSDNPFSFYTTCIHNSFLQILSVEKKHRRIRDQMLIDMGENASYSFTDELKNHRGEGGEFTNELSELKDQIEEAKIRIAQEAEAKVIRNGELAAAAALATASLLEFDEK